MIQNILTFCVKNDLTFVEGSIPSGKLVANDINRNSIYLITPYDESIVKANFQTNLQSDTPTSVLGILVNGKISVDEIVDTTASYYNLVKDWNIYEFKVPSTTLSFISRNRTGKIGINFSIEQRLVPTIKDSYGTYKGEITELAQTPIENGYYIIKALGYEYQDSVELKSFDLNDILVYNATTDVATKISAYSNRGSTPTTLYSVDPSLLNDNFETIEPSLTTQIVQQVNDNTGDIVLLFQNVGVNNSTLVDLENRVSVAEQDIDTAEENITNLQGRMATAESDIDNIEDGTTIVEKALRDSLGNIIKDSYVSSVYPTYNDTTDKLFIETYDVRDGLLANNEVILPKATTTKNGLMAKEDKIKINAIASDIASAISTHDGSQTSHLYIRTLINNLQKEVDRLNAKGRSWGEVDKTFSELWAMAEPTRSDYINTFLATAFSGYTPSNGDLVYTIVSDTEEEHELEYNSTLSQWVDNGAYIVSKASNTQHGIVKGDLDYVSILNGIIQVLKSDYATNVGSSGASYDYDDLLALFTEVANDIYKKNETYSATQIEQRLTDLLAMANLQDVLIGSYTNGQTVLASDLSPYNFVIALGNDDGSLYTGIFKPSEIVNDTVISLSPDVVDLTRDATSFTITTPTSVKLWGIKLDGITADEISYDGTISGLVADKVQDAIDEITDKLADKVSKSDGTEQSGTLVTEKWWQNTGVEFSKNDGLYCVADVQEGEKYLVSGLYVDASFLIWQIRGVDNAFVSQSTQTGSAYQYFENIEVTIPAGGTKLYVNGGFSSINNGSRYPIIFKKIGYTPDIADISNKMSKQLTFEIAGTFVENKFIVIRNGKAQAEDSGTYNYSVINYDSTKQYKFTGLCRATAIPIFVFTDENDYVIKIAKNSVGDYIDDETYTIPAGTKKIYVNGYAGVSQATIKVGRESIICENPWKNKVGICLGDSVMQGVGSLPGYNNEYAGFKPKGYDAPYWIGEILGCTVYNGGLGGGTAGGIRTIDFKNVADCIVSGDFSSIVTGISQYRLNGWANYWYDKIADLDFSKVDFILIGFGYNDWNFSGGSESVFKDGLRYGIEAILTAYPNIQIYLAAPGYCKGLRSGTPWDSDTYPNASSGLYLYQFAQYIEEVAREYKIPCFNVYYKGGVNSINFNLYVDNPTNGGPHRNSLGYKLLGEQFAKFIGSN